MNDLYASYYVDTLEDGGLVHFENLLWQDARMTKSVLLHIIDPVIGFYYDRFLLLQHKVCPVMWHSSFEYPKKGPGSTPGRSSN